MSDRERNGLLMVLLWGVIGSPLVFVVFDNTALAVLIFLAILATVIWYYYIRE
jgi:hypothetical protein